MKRHRGQSLRDHSGDTATPAHDVEETSGTVACEQCRVRKVRCDKKIPECSNCAKAGVPCELPNREKRVNHAKLLAKEVSTLSGRLDAIEGKIDSLIQHMSVPQRVKDPRLSHSSNLPFPETLSLDNEDMEIDFDTNQRDQHTPRSSGAQQRLESTCGVRNSVQNIAYRNQIAARCLFENSKQALEELLEKIRNQGPREGKSDSHDYLSNASGELKRANPHIEAELKAKCVRYPILSSQESIAPSGNGQSVSLPPRCLVDSSLEIFLEGYNNIAPLFNEANLREAIDACYSSKCANMDEAYNLCFNNIIVLALGLRYRLSRMGESLLDGLNGELLPTFWNNSFRALQHLDVFFQPRLVNIQALASLAMVAREYHESKTYDMVCHMACLVAKSIDIHQRNGLNRNATKIDQERGNLYWTLFVMDKQRTYISGRPFDIHFYDSDIEVISQETPSADRQCHSAHIHMMSIWEEIYIRLYSLRAFRKGPSYRQRQVAKLDCLTTEWCTRNSDLLAKHSPEEKLSIKNWLIELKYCFHLARILIHRCSDEKISKQIVLDNSRAALREIQCVFNSAHTEGSVALLSRLLRNYPLVSIHGLYKRFLTNPTRELLADIDLISVAAEALGAICDPKAPNACLPRIHAGILWYMEIAQIIRDAIENPQIQQTSHRKTKKRSLNNLKNASHREERRGTLNQPKKRPRSSTTDDSRNPHGARNETCSPTSFAGHDSDSTTLSDFLLQHNPLAATMTERAASHLLDRYTDIEANLSANDFNVLGSYTPPTSICPSTYQSQHQFQRLLCAPPQESVLDFPGNLSSLTPNKQDYDSTQDSNIFDSFIQRSDFLNSAEPESAENPMFDDFLRF